MRLTVQLDTVLITFHGPDADEAYPWLLDVGALRDEARAGNGRTAEVANVTVTLDNAGDKAEAILRQPLRRRATLYDDAGRVHFAGIVQGVTPGPELVLTVEA